MDATCCPADIRYPTDVSLLNEAREITERIIDALYILQCIFEKKPRDYRRKAHLDFVRFTKKRKPGRKAVRRAIKQQIQYLRRNFTYINRMAKQVPLQNLSKKLQQKLDVILTVYSQQLFMYESKTHKVDDRIVSISQPHIRPIVRGKAGKPVEFGAKISLSLANGYCYLDRLSWDNYNESVDLIDQIENYKKRFGYFPDSVHADKIYRTRVNRKFCDGHNIRLSGKPLGRPPIETESNKDELAVRRKQRRDDEIDRILIEGCFGVCKRKYGMGLIKSKLKETSETDIYISVMVLNLDKCCRAEMKENANRYRICEKQAS